MQKTHTGVTLVVSALTAFLALTCLPHSGRSSPLLPPSSPSHPTHLEQELDALNPKLPLPDVSKESVIHNPKDPSPYPSSLISLWNEDAARDVLEDDQDVNEKESSPDSELKGDVSLGVATHLLEDSASLPAVEPPDDDIPSENVPGKAEELEPAVASLLSPVLKETEPPDGQDEEEELLQVLNGYGREAQGQGINVDKDGQDGHLHGQGSRASEVQETHGQDADLLSIDSQERQSQDSSFQFKDSQEEELQTLQASNSEKNNDDDVDDDDEEEDEDDDDDEDEEDGEVKAAAGIAISVKDQEENQATAQELDSITRHGWKDSYSADDMYNGYDDDDDDVDEYDDDDEDDGDTEDYFWRRVAADEHPQESYPEELPHVAETSSFVKNRKSSSYLDFAMKLNDVEELPPYSFDDIMAAEELGGKAWHKEIKRGEEEEEEEEEEERARFQPVRVIVLNETLYLNTTEDDGLPKFRPVPMPEKFEAYDVNKDGVISLPELRYVSRATEGVRQAFREADIDGDGWLNNAEFHRAAWVAPLEYNPPPPPPRQDTPLPPPSWQQGTRAGGAERGRRGERLVGPRRGDDP